jgi:hypothetical protein
MRHVRPRFATVVALALLLAGGASGAGASSAPRPSACAPRAPIELPVDPWPAARSKLAPSGASAIRLCRYDGLDSKPARGLARSALVTNGPAIATLIGELDALPAMSKKAFCPIDTGAEIVALIAYPGDHGVLVAIDLTGCAIASNGIVVRTAGSTPAGHALLAKIEHLTDYRGTVFQRLAHSPAHRQG